jgi:hypothetical protein
VSKCGKVCVGRFVAFDAFSHRLYLLCGHSCLYILVLEPTENRALASHFLTAFPRLLCDHFRSTSFAGQAKQLIGKPDEVILLLQRALPGGMLAYLTSALARAARRDTDDILTSAKA